MRINELEVGKLYTCDGNKYDLYKIEENGVLKVKRVGESDDCLWDSSVRYNDILKSDFEEYISQVDWSKIEVDTKVYVRDNACYDWKPRYFAKYENGIFYAWIHGATSWSAESEQIEWKYYKLAEESKD